MIGAGLPQWEHTSYVPIPNADALGYRGSGAVLHTRKSIEKRGDVGRFVLRANAKTDGSWRVQKNVISISAAGSIFETKGSRLAKSKEETGDVYDSPAQRAEGTRDRDASFLR